MKRFVVPLVLIVISIVITGAGGYIDMMGKNSINIPGTSFMITKHHLWNDGFFILSLAVALSLLLK
jgi:hypothetical protein